MDSVGGRGGGKPGNAQGQVPQCDDIIAVIAKAESFASALKRCKTREYIIYVESDNLFISFCKCHGMNLKMVSSDCLFNLLALVLV